MGRHIGRQFEHGYSNRRAYMVEKDNIMVIYYDDMLDDFVIKKEIDDFHRTFSMQEIHCMIMDSIDFTAWCDMEEPEYLGNDCACYDYEIETSVVDGMNTYLVLLSSYDVRCLNRNACLSIRLNAEKA